MKTIALHLIACLAIALFTAAAIAQVDNRDFDLGGGGGAGSCRTCVMNGYGLNGSISMSCSSPDLGSSGHENCRIESYPEGSYCFVDGNECCVD